MKGFAEWIERRRKSLGLDRQIDLAEAARVSLSVVSSLERTGSTERMTPAIRRLLSIALRVAEKDFERLARGEIADAPVVGENAVDVLKWVAAQDARKQAEIMGALSLQEVVTISQAAADRLSAYARSIAPAGPVDLRTAAQRQAEMEAIAAANADHEQKQKNPPPRKARAG